MKVVTRSEQGWRSRCYNGERVSQSLLTARPGSRDESGPPSRWEATSGSVRYRPGMAH